MTELDEMLNEAKIMHEMLANAVIRRDNNVECSSIDEHLTKCRSSVFAITSHFEGVPASYRVDQCLICGKWILSSYTGERIRVIDEGFAKKLMGSIANALKSENTAKK